MQKHAKTMPMIQKEKALWPARTRTIHAAAMPSYSMQISAVFAKLSFKQHQTFVPSFQFWNNNYKSEPYLQVWSKHIKTCYVDYLLAWNVCLINCGNIQHQTTQDKENTMCSTQAATLTNVWFWPENKVLGRTHTCRFITKKTARYREQKMPATMKGTICIWKPQSSNTNIPALQIQHTAGQGIQSCRKLDDFLLGDSIYLVEHAVRKNAAWQLAINIDQMRVLAQCNFYRARKKMKTWYGANKAARQLQSRCQKLALGQHPSSCSCRNWIKSVLPCLLTSPDGSVLRALCFAFILDR